MDKTKKIIIILLAGFLLVEVGILFVDSSNLVSANSLMFWKEGNQDLEEYAKQIVKDCKDAEFRPECYRKEIPELMSKISMEDTFQVTKQVQNMDQSYYYCHVLGHEISGRETAKDPSKWKEVVTRCPRGLCSNGCIHGAFQERFRVSALPDADINKVADEIEGLCKARGDWDPTGLERATCYHALGHLTMYVTDANAEKSTELCDEVVINRDNAKNYKELCYDGAFMQLFQPLAEEDFALIEGKVPEEGELKDFCWQFEGTKRASCWSEAWPRNRQGIKDPEFMTDYCQELNPGDGRNRCFASMFALTSVQFHFEPDRIKSYCSGVPEDRSPQCFTRASSRMVETDYRNIPDALSLCKSITDEENKDACFSGLITYSTYNFKAGSENSLKLCNGMPSPWHERCMERQREARTSKEASLRGKYDLG